MPGIVEFPTVVQGALGEYGDIFANECQRRHFAEYLTGLIVPERKTVLGINGEFAQTTDQSCLTGHIPDVKHKVRIVIIWRYKNDDEPCKILVTNRINWEVSRIVRVYRHRWTGTETFHRDGKQQLGLGDCQLRDFQGQARHMYLVMLAYSLLMSQLRQGRAREWALHRLMTIGEACRAMLRESLRTTLAWAIEQVVKRDQPMGRVITQPGLS